MMPGRVRTPRIATPAYGGGMPSSPRQPTTLPAAYAARLRDSPGDPFVTFYDLVSGERVELSATTWVNWAAKIAGYLTEEMDLERGARLLVDLPAHWQSSVVLGGAWWAGIEVVAPAGGAARDEQDVACVDAVVCAEADAAAYADASVPVAALSLKPMSAPCGPLPGDVVDLGREVLSQPDAYAPLDPPEPDDAAWAAATGDDRRTQADLLASPDDARRLTREAPTSAAGAGLLGSALAGRGSLVLVAGPADTEVPGWLTDQENVGR